MKSLTDQVSPLCLPPNLSFVVPSSLSVYCIFYFSAFVQFSNLDVKLKEIFRDLELKYFFITPPSGARGGLKENGQNPDSGSKNSENQNNDAVS